jgi:prefoldin subunit 5
VANQEADKIAEQRQVANQNIESVKERMEQLNTALSKPAEVFRKLP